MPYVTKWVQTLNKPQQKALKRKYDQSETVNRKMTYRQFRKTVRFSYDCAMVHWCGMWLGIEKDGYTHS
jgi:hypothetical protein